MGQPGAGHRTLFDNCPEYERAPELAFTGVFERVSGTGMG